MSQCDLPTPGWVCYGDSGHDGPCAAWPLCPPPVTPMSKSEHFVGQWAGQLLIWLAKKAVARGDMHEHQHILAAAIMGNSQHNNEPCRLAGMW